MTYNIINANCLSFLQVMDDNSIDSICCDPPYGLSQHTTEDIKNCIRAWLDNDAYTHDKAGFMGKDWDSFVPGPEIWKECLRVLKPGGHILAFAGTRTMDLMCMSIRLGGFELRDSIGYAHDSGGAPLLAWVCGSGFPKSVNKKIGDNDNWNGWGTALKPSWEPIILARKPIEESTIPKNILKYGTGGLNIDGCRIPSSDEVKNHSRSAESSKSKGIYGDSTEQETHQTDGQLLGRFPANIIHDGSEDIIKNFPDSSCKRIEKPSDCKTTGTTSFDCMRGNRPARGYTDNGSAARFFYCAKTSKTDRDEGLDAFEVKRQDRNNGGIGRPCSKEAREGEDGVNAANSKNTHPTVKPNELMKYLVRLITPPNGLVLDPFMGSGSTGKACMSEGFSFIGIDISTDYCEIAEARIKHAYEQAQKEPEKTSELFLHPLYT